jgi:uncharacterized protein (TIGR00645 family)
MYAGLLLTLIPILYRFFHSFVHLFSQISSLSPADTTLQVLDLLDTLLLGNLVVIILFTGYENFVAKIKVADTAEDRPHWMGHVDFSGLKIKLIGSLVAISVIELLKDFMHEGSFDSVREAWRIGIHVTFVISGLLFAFMDNVADRHKSER